MDRDKNACSDCGYQLDYSDEDVTICWRCDAQEYKRMYDKAVEQTRWIPVEERLPKNTNSWPIEVWSVVEFTGIDAKHIFYQNSKFYEGEWTDPSGDLIEGENIKVVAWKPLPEPYKP